MKSKMTCPFCKSKSVHTTQFLVLACAPIDLDFCMDCNNFGDFKVIHELIQCKSCAEDKHIEKYLSDKFVAFFNKSKKKKSRR